MALIKKGLLNLIIIGIRCKIIYKIFIKSLNKTKLIAEILALKSNPGDVFFLKGSLGSGKTTFARNFIKFLSKKIKKNQNVVSPTYNLIQNYNCDGKKLVCHIDLYRLKNIKEILNLGLFEEIENKIALIEWPDKIEKFFKDRIEINFKSEKKAIENRTIILKGYGKNHKKKLDSINLKKFII